MMNDEIKDEEVTDALPDDLDVHGFVGPYQFPDNSRRRIPGFLYLFLSIVFSYFQNYLIHPLLLTGVMLLRQLLWL